METSQMVAEMKSKGWKIRIYHNRFLKINNEKRIYSMGEIRRYEQQKFIYPYGGSTMASAMRADGVEIAAVALCNPIDKYELKKGANLSLERLKKVVDKVDA